MHGQKNIKKKKISYQFVMPVAWAGKLTVHTQQLSNLLYTFSRKLWGGKKYCYFSIKRSLGLFLLQAPGLKIVDLNR